MTLLDLAPSAPLREVVRLIQVIEFAFAGGSELPFKAYPPRPEHCLAFYPRDAEHIAYPGGPARQPKPRAVLIGQHAVVSHRYVGRTFLALQVVLQPGALWRLTGIPQRLLTNTYVDAEAVWGADIRALNARLSGMATWAEMLPHVEAFLLSRLPRLGPSQPADAAARRLLTPGAADLSLTALADYACLSPRQLTRQFTERLGVSPHLYARIARFDRAFRFKNAHPGLDWLSVALACGYHDHQHLAKDYHAFTGSSPGAFFRQDTQAPERQFGLFER